MPHLAEDRRSSQNAASASYAFLARSIGTSRQYVARVVAGDE